MELPTSSVKVVGTKQRQDVEPWNEVASEFEKAVVALRTAEPDTPGELPSELSSQRNLDAVADLGCAAQEEAPFELSPDLALLDAGIAQDLCLSLRRNCLPRSQSGTDWVPGNQSFSIKFTRGLKNPLKLAGQGLRGL